MNEIAKLRSMVINEEYQNYDRNPQSLFAGAGLVITDNPNARHKVDDAVIVSQYAYELSWLVFKLKEVYKEDIDYANKLAFYPTLGEKIKESLEENKTLKTILIGVVNEAASFFGDER